MPNNEEIKKQRMERILNQDKLRRKDCENKTFKFVGVVNPLKIIPSFVVPIFVCEQDGKKYAQEGDDDTLTLNSFYETTHYRDLRDVIYLDEIKSNEFSDSIFTIHSKPIFAFQTSEKEYFIGYGEDLKTFLKGYSIDDEILKQEINDFMKCG